MSCLKCGSTLPEGSVLCAKCGSPVRDDPAAQKVNETSAMYSTASVAYPGIMRTSTRLRVDPAAALRWLRSFWPLVLESLLVIAFGSIAATDWPPFSERTFWVLLGLVAGTSVAVTLVREAVVTDRGVLARFCFGIAGATLFAESYVLLHAASIAFAR